VHSDARLLEQMIRNLLSNAVKYTQHGEVLLGCRRRGDKLRIEVWDTGPGIPAGELQAIFEEFHQLDNPAREHSRGLGLGLAIVQRLAELLGVTVDVRSRPGHGSVFAVEVPIGGEVSARQAAAIAGDPEVEPRRAGTMLVVEDDPALRETLTLLLEAEGFNTVAAANGSEALALIGRGAPAPDLIIADFNLPNGLNGLQVIARVQDSLPRPVPSIILTGDVSTETLREIGSHGAVQLNKPVRSRELTNRIQRLLATPPPAPERPPPSAPRPGGTNAVVVVDDDRGVRESMVELLRLHGHAAEGYASGAAFLEARHGSGEGCLIVDAVMPGMGGLELLRRLKETRRDLPAIMITGHGDVRTAVEAMRAGAMDFIEKPVARGELLASIDRALGARRDAAKRAAWHEAAAARLADLTPRQREILEGILAGRPNKIIAADLGISQRTVENHRAAIMRRTGVSSIPDLVRLALAGMPAMTSQRE
jgi:two-component system CheB/CheR fusion protein